jgi:membrane protein DedA with SNARE-associated domain
MAYSGAFYLPKLIFLSAFGTIMTGQLVFYIGRIFGKKLLNKYPIIETKSKKIFFLINKYDVPFIIGFRFVYGIRTISPFFIGLSNVSILKFSIFNIISGIIWSVLICMLGYYIGAFSDSIAKDHWYISLIFNLLITLIFIIVFHIISKKIVDKQ